MRLNNWIVTILLLVGCWSCIETFEPDIRESFGVLVIEGKITDIPGIHSVTVSRSSPYTNAQYLPVTGCIVRVEDDSGNGVTYNEKGSGTYQTDLEPGFMEVGKAYKLLVFTPDGQAYESDYDFLLACAPIDNLSYKVEIQGTSDPAINHYGIRFYADMTGTPEESRNYLWTLEESWVYRTTYPIQYIWDGFVLHDYTPQLHEYKTCYLTSNLEEFQVGSSNLLATNEINQQSLNFVSNRTPRLREKYSLLVRQHSLSDRAFLFWDGLRKQTGDRFGLFETQPSETRGNIYNVNKPEEKVLGYFFATQVTEKRITITEQLEFPIPDFSCPLDTAIGLGELGTGYLYMMFSLSPFGMGPPYAYSLRECHDCRYRGGVTTKPDNWDDWK